MKKATRHLSAQTRQSARLVIVLLIWLFTSTGAYAQTLVQGNVLDAKKAPLVGVNVVVKGTTTGTATDANGAFKLTVPNSVSELVFSFVGYVAQTIPTNGRTTINVTLNETTASLDEVIVTGVFDKRSRMESSVAISTLNARDIERLVPNSAADLLKNVPGVYVNSSQGEVQNVVYSRGVSANSQSAISDSPNGYYYVSLQEDGLPVSAVSSSDLSPDFFYRSDATVKRLEAVRGGTSSITGANAPGGIFNFLTKAGGANAGSEVRVRLGLEGDGRNPYYRADFNTGGTMGKQWDYNVGGFYRYAEGARYAGYPLNNGGQLKANATRHYANGSVRIYAKYLNDHNGTMVPLVGQGFNNNITLAPGVNKADSYMLPGTSVVVPNGSDTRFTTFDPKKLNHATDATFGINWQHDLSDTWSITNNAKYSAKTRDANVSISTNFTYLDDFITSVFSGAINLGPGTITYKDRQSNQVVAQVQQNFGPQGPSYAVLNSTLPDAVKGAIRYTGALKLTIDDNEFMDQLTVNKRLKNGSITGGLFFANSHVSATNLRAPGLGLTLVKDRAEFLDVSFKSVSGTPFQISDPATGYLKLGGSFGYTNYDYTNNQLAFFLGNTLNLSDNLNFDWGARYESINIQGTNDPTVPTTKVGGIDGNPLTLYDNFYGVTGTAPFRFNKSLSTFSYSGGLNYTFNPNTAVYIRYTRGQKSPDLSFYNTYTSQFVVDNNPPKNQDITQFEVGFKVKTSRLSAVITPFYSQLDNVGSTVLATDENAQLYYTSTLYNKTETMGVEIEANWALSPKLSIRGAVTAQQGKYLKLQTWNVVPNTPKTNNTIIDYTGNRIENNPNLIITLTPTYTVGKFYGLVQWKYLGDRPANQPNAYNLPAFSQFDLGAGYAATKRLSFSVNINNATNVLGIMGSASPGGFLQAVSPQNLTKAQIEANPNAVHSILPIQPRAYFMTAIYNF